MKRYVTAALILAFTGVVQAGTVAQGRSTDGHRIRLTDERCTVVSGRSTQPGWGRTFAWLDSGLTVTGCGVLDNDTVLIEWFTPGGLDIRRYNADDFTWIPPRRLLPLDK